MQHTAGLQIISEFLGCSAQNLPHLPAFDTLKTLLPATGGGHVRLRATRPERALRLHRRACPGESQRPAVPRRPTAGGRPAAASGRFPRPPEPASGAAAGQFSFMY